MDTLGSQPMQLLTDAIGEFLGPELVHRHIVLRPDHGRARARFFAAGAVLAEHSLPSGEEDLEVSMPRRAFEHLCRSEGLPDEPISARVEGEDDGKACAHPEPFLKSRASSPSAR